jgi:DNA-binding NarL/FixJ family response regulator
VLIDDHMLFRDGIRRILEAHSDFVVVGEAGSGPQGVERVAQTLPDVVLLDVELPGPGVAETVRRLRASAPRTHVIILSMYDNSALLTQLIKIGIRGYLLKSISHTELVANLRAVCGDPNRLVLSVSQTSLAGSGIGAGLTEREHEVLVLTAAALSNAQIAARLSLTEATVKRHLRGIFAKLGAVSRIDAVNKAIEAHLITGNERQGWH